MQPKVLDVISYLVRMRDRVVLKRELLDAVWADVVVSEASISRVIVEARRALGDELQQVIVTVRGRGFRFAGQVSESDGRSQGQAAEPVNDPTFVGREASLTPKEPCAAEGPDRGRAGKVTSLTPAAPSPGRTPRPSPTARSSAS